MEERKRDEGVLKKEERGRKRGPDRMQERERGKNIDSKWKEKEENGEI